MLLAALVLVEAVTIPFPDWDVDGLCGQMPPYAAKPCVEREQSSYEDLEEEWPRLTDAQRTRVKASGDQARNYRYTVAPAVPAVTSTDSMLVTVVLAAAAALSWLAYNQSGPFRLFSLVLKAAATLGLAFLAGYQAGAVAMEKAVLAVLPTVTDPLVGPKLHAPVAAVGVPAFWMALLVGLNAYVILLDYLPNLGIVPKDK